VKLSLDFDLQPVSNRFYSLNSDQVAPKFPLGIEIDSESGLIKLKSPFPVEELKPRHGWLTCFEPEDHLDNLVDKLIKLPRINNNSVIGAYSFKDDSTIERLNDRGYHQTWRIDPDSDLCVDKMANVETYQQVFTLSKSMQIKEKYGAADILLVRHVVEHAYDISEFVAAIRLLVKSDGYIIWELPDCKKALLNGDCTMVWEEHIHYFTEFTFKQFLLTEKFKIIDFSSIEYPLENCLVAITRKSGNKDDLIENNIKSISIEVERAKQYLELLHLRKKSVRRKLNAISKKYGNLAFFGAGHFTCAFISIMGIQDLVDYVVDDNLNKKDRKLPAGGISIVGSDALYKKNLKVCLLGLNPQSHDKVISNHKEFVKNGGVFASIFPGTDRYFEDIL